MATSTPPDRLAEVLTALRVTLDQHADVNGSHSGAHVHFGTRDGAPVVVKATVGGGHMREAALRELAVLDGSLAVRVPTPALVASHVDDDLAVVVMQRLQASGTADTWPTQRWLDLVDLLATLHDHGSSLDLRQHQRDHEDLDLDRDAGGHLLALDDDRIDLLVPDPADRVLFDHVFAQLATAPRPHGPRTLVHGDCHVDNVVIDDSGTLVLTDWANVAWGHPANELAFLLCRSVPTGAQPPVEQLLERYADRRGLDLAALTRDVHTHQLVVLGRQYPEYFAFLSAPEIERVRQTFLTLARGW